MTPDPVPAEPETTEATFIANGKQATYAEVARLIVEQTTAAQGLPFHVEDPATLRLIAQLTSPEKH